MRPPDHQDNYEIALRHAFAGARAQSPENIERLGAVSMGSSAYALPVLNVTFHIDLEAETIYVAVPGADNATPVSPTLWWRVIALHYLTMRPLAPQPDRWMTFSDFPDIRGYESVYKGRVLGRLCGTAGRERDTFTKACLRLGAIPAPHGDVGFEFRVFPEIALRLSWYAGDDEFPPAASFLFPEDILQRLPVEDVIVVGESIVGLLQGKRW